jgi:23S rRNA pseudouridine1911/1915/1917 synthase
MNRKEIYADIENPMLLEDFLRKEKGISARLLRKLKHSPNIITRNDKLIRTIDMVYPHDIIVLVTHDNNEIIPNSDLKVKILYEDDDVVVFDKPPMMPVHPSHKHHFDTLGNYFSAKFPDKTFRPINRLDRDTSGTCAVAKNQQYASFLQNNIKKTYFAIVSGRTETFGTIDLPIKRVADTLILRCVASDGKRAVTHYEVIKQNDDASLLKINLETGRTHQIRVHFSHIGHSLFGDDLYGGNLDFINRQALHCGQLEFYKMKTGEKIVVKSELPEDMVNLLNSKDL